MPDPLVGRQIIQVEHVKQGDQVVITPPVDLEDGNEVQLRATAAAS